MDEIQISFRVDKHFWREVARACFEMDVSKKEFMIRALKKYMEELKQC